MYKSVIGKVMYGKIWVPCKHIASILLSILTSFGKGMILINKKSGRGERT